MRKTATFFCLSILLVTSGVFVLPRQAEAAECPPGSEVEDRSLNCIDGAGQVVGSIREAGGPVECAGDLENLLNPFTCLMRGIFAGIGSLFMYFGILLLTWAGLLFEFALKATTVNFQAGIFKHVEGGVNIAWTAFRDIANILIIGIFTFIALSIIIGLKEYGQKKLIANVLIIAVLINFSLLFTKMIVDASNFTANQFYVAALQSTDEGGALEIGGGDISNSADIQVTQKEKNGIAGSFMQFLGVTGIYDSYYTLREIQENNDDASVGLIYGLISFVFLIATAIIFFYGTFLLVSRALILIFLMITASIAFASYLVPKWSGSSYGWDAWWKSLIGSAALAPVLMLLLWVTLNISQALSSAICNGAGEVAKCGTLGALMTSTEPGANIAALFNFILILGMLFIAFKLSSTFASKISGFSMAAMAAVLPLTLGSRLAGALGRLGIGAPAYFAGKRYGKEAGVARDAAATAEIAARRHERAGNFGIASQAWAEAALQKKLAASKLATAGRLGSLADKKFNLMDTAGAKAALGAVGIKGFAAGASSKDTKSFAGTIKARAEAAEKSAAKIAPSEKDNEGARKVAEETTREARRAQREQLEATKNSAEAIANQTKELEELPRKMTAAQQDLRTAEDTSSRNKVALDQQLNAGTITQAQHAAEMAVEKNRINNAKDIVERIQGRINVIEKPVVEALKGLEDHDKETANAIKEAQTEATLSLAQSAEDIAGKIGERQGDVLTRLVGKFTGANAAVAAETAEKYKGKVSTAKLRKVFEEMQKETASSAAPAAAPDTH